MSLNVAPGLNNDICMNETDLIYTCICLCFTGIILEYVQGGIIKTRSIDLLDLRPEYVITLYSLRNYIRIEKA